MMWIIFNYIDLLLFLYFALCVGTIGIHALAAKKSTHDIKRQINKAKQYRYAIIVDASGFDLRQPNCLKSLAEQDYNNDLYDVLLQKENHYPSTIDSILDEIDDSTKKYDNIILLDIADVIPQDFITRMNIAYCLSNMPIEAHKIDSSHLMKESLHKSIKEEVYTQLFKNGCASLGLPYKMKLTNGMLMNIAWIRKYKELFYDLSQSNFYLAMRGQYVVFLNDFYIYYDEASLAKRHEARTAINKEKHLDNKGRINYTQEISANRMALTMDLAVILLISRFLPTLRFMWLSLTVIGAITMVIDFSSSVKWIILLLLLTFFIMLCIPNRLVTKHFDYALLRLLFENKTKRTK